MALNAFKYIFICLRESGWKAAALVFPEHVRSVLSKETELSPEGSRRCYFSGACSVIFPCLPLAFVVQLSKYKGRQIWQEKSHL